MKLLMLSLHWVLIRENYTETDRQTHIHTEFSVRGPGLSCQMTWNTKSSTRDKDSKTNKMPFAIWENYFKDVCS